MSEKETIAKLVSRITALDQLKEDTEYSREVRMKAADASAECYDQLLRLCNGDAEYVARLLGQKEWFDANRKKKLP